MMKTENGRMWRELGVGGRVETVRSALHVFFRIRKLWTVNMRDVEELNRELRGRGGIDYKQKVR